MSEHPGRSTPERVALGVSTAILVAVFALVAGQLRHPHDPADPVARIETVRPVGGRFHVDVAVRNDGDQTAVNVQVSAEVETPDGSVSGDQTVDFLPGGGKQHVTFVFDDDPESGGLTVAVTGFADP